MKGAIEKVCDLVTSHMKGLVKVVKAFHLVLP